MDTLLIVVLLVFLAFYVISIRNNIIKMFNASKRAWAEVSNYERQKGKILESLEPVVAQYSSYESSVLKNITELRTNILTIDGEKADIEQLQKIEQQTDHVMKSLAITVENYPDLKANGVYMKLMREITNQNENVGAAISILNRNIEMFNNYIEVFPNNIVNNSFTHRQRMQEFSDSSTDKNIEYKPNF